MSNEEDTFNALRGTIVKSKHGGYYAFVPYFSGGRIHTYGGIHDAIKDKTICGQLITEWLGAYIKEDAFMAFVNMTEIYADRVTITYPEPGTYWSWKDK